MITEEVKIILVNCGAFYFSDQKTANNITTDLKENAKIIKKLSEINSEYRKLYNIGSDQSEYAIMEKLFNLAKSGDMPAIKEYDRRIKINKSHFK